MKRAASIEEVSIMAGSSEDHKVTHLELAHMKHLDMVAISQRYPNLEKLVLINCSMACVPDMTVWAQKRRLVCISCSGMEAAEMMSDSLAHLHVDVDRPKPTMFHITWKKNCRK